MADTVAGEFMGTLLQGQEVQANQLNMQYQRAQLQEMLAEEPFKIQQMQGTADLTKLQVQRMRREDEAGRNIAEAIRAGQQPGAQPLTMDQILKKTSEEYFKEGLLQPAVEAQKSAADLAGKQAELAEKQRTLFQGQVSDFRDFVNPANGHVTPQQLQQYVLQNHPELLQDPRVAATYKQLLQNPGSWNQDTQRKVYQAITTEQQRLDDMAKRARAGADAAYADKTEMDVKVDRMLLGADTDSRAAGSKAGAPPPDAPKASIPEILSEADALGVQMPGDAKLKLVAARAWQRKYPTLTADEIMKKVAEERANSPIQRGSAVQLQQNMRIVGAANVIAGAFDTFMKMPVSTSAGVTGVGGNDTWLGVAHNYLGKKFSPEVDNLYASFLPGLNRSVAIVDAFGSAYGVAGLAESLKEQLTFKPGQPVSAKLGSLADIRDNTLNTLDVVQTNPEVPATVKAKLAEIETRLRTSLPFSRNDVVEFTLKGKKGESLGEFVKRQGIEQASQPLSVGDVRGGYRYTGGDPADQTSWEKVSVK